MLCKGKGVGIRKSRVFLNSNQKNPVALIPPFWRNRPHYSGLDVHNGILLSPTYDALFDRHLISFENNGKIILSEPIAQEAYAKIGVTGRESISNLSEFNLSYLEKHRSELGG